MRKTIILILLCVMAGMAVGASIKGSIIIEGGDSFGVFVYIESENIYDITDENGNFLLEGLKKDKEYRISFQKENYPEYKKLVSLDKIEKTVKIHIKKLGDSKRKYSVRGSVISKLNNRIFLNIPKLAYGIIVKPRKAFYFELEEGEYSADVIQEGTYEKRIEFKVQEKDLNDIGNIKLKQKEKNNLRLLFDKVDTPLYIYLYKGEDIIKSKKIEKTNPSILWTDLKPGKYKLLTKGYTYKEQEIEIYLKGVVRKKISLEKLKKENNVYLNIYPEGLKTAIKIYENETLIKEVENIKDFYIIGNLDTSKEYKIKFKAEKYKDFELRKIRSGEKVEVSLIREIKGSLIKGNIYPFNSQAEIMILKKGKILGKTRIDTKGRFELELDSIKSEKYIIRVYAKGFKEERIVKNLNKGKELTGLNIELESLVTSIFGKIETGDFERKDCLVIIDELNIWQFTNEKGEYYFNNIPDGKYKLIVKKLGYDEVKKEINIIKQRSKKINIKLRARAKLIIKSNLKNYDLIINGEKERVKNFVFERKLDLGKINVLLKRKGSLDIEDKFFFTEPGQEKTIKIEFKSFQAYKMGLQNRVFEIEDAIESLEVKTAERRLSNFKRMKHWELYKNKVYNLEKNLAEAKISLFEADRNIRKEIKDIRLEIESIENSNMSFRKRRSKLQKKYKESLEEIGYILKERHYTSLKSNLYLLQGDIYMKMGMVNSARKSYSDAERVGTN